MLTFIVRFSALVLLAIGMSVAGALFLLSPVSFYAVKDVTIESGSTLTDAARTLKEHGVIRSTAAFQSLVLFKGGERGVVAGEYRFTSPESSFDIADRLLNGDFGMGFYTVTIPEGLTTSDIAVLLAEHIPGFDEDKFRTLAKEHEGFLFPATYELASDATPEAVIALMQETFDERVAELIDNPRPLGVSFEEVVTMASIVEEEAKSEDSKRIVSGILWKRLKEGMPLQVDASFLYLDSLAHKTSASLTMSDLNVESPYNTYENLGLPPTPISNPGLASIEAALNPIESAYYYYLSDLQGNMYYAVSLEEHSQNRVYLEM